MKYTITINQSAVFINGLVNKTDAVDWVIIDYLKDFALYKKARKIVYQKEEYIWLNYNHLIASLPLIHFKGTWTVSRRISKLRKLGLIKTVKDKDNTLYYIFTDRLIDICFSRQSDINRIRKTSSDCLCEEAKRLKQSLVVINSSIGDCHANARNDRSIISPALAENATPPIASSATDPIATSATAQYKTKISIINKDNNKEDISFSSSFSKNKKDYHESTKQRKHENHFNTAIKKSSAGSAVRNVKGFNTFNGNIWKVLDNIRLRQIQNAKVKMQNDNSKSKSV